MSRKPAPPAKPHETRPHENPYHHTLRAEDVALWEAIARTVKPLHGRRLLLSGTAHEKPHPVPAKPVASKPAPSGANHKPAPIAPKSAPLMQALQPPIRKKVIRGTKAIDGRLDLHGMRQEEAHRTLLHFLMSAQAQGRSMVLVITGKGNKGGEEYGVLRRAVPQWLAMPDFRPLVVGFETAHLTDGGEGALYLHVRRRRQAGEP